VDPATEPKSVRESWGVSGRRAVCGGHERKRRAETIQGRLTQRYHLHVLQLFSEELGPHLAEGGLIVGDDKAMRRALSGIRGQVAPGQVLRHNARGLLGAVDEPDLGTEHPREQRLEERVMRAAEQ